jgi:hypothetical protein
MFKNPPALETRRLWIRPISARIDYGFDGRYSPVFSHR